MLARALESEVNQAPECTIFRVWRRIAHITEDRGNAVEMAALAQIASPGKLVEIAIEMLLADPVPDANDRAADLALDAFGSVRVSIDLEADWIASDELCPGICDSHVHVPGGRLAISGQSVC